MSAYQTLLQEQLRKYYVDFDIAMGKGTGYFREIERYQERDQEYFDFLKELYQKNHFLNVEPQDNPKIPKIIHQIWIGNRKIPQKLQEYQKTWREQNLNWEYKFWTNEDVENYTFVNEDLKSLFDQPLTLGERVDVLRYDILYQYGGVYADCDCICLKPFDIFAYCYDFFAGISQPSFAGANPSVCIQNCLLGAKPKHPIIKKLSLIMVENWDNVDYKEDEIYTTIQRTFLNLTLAIVNEAGKFDNVDIAMPPSYFLPITAFPIHDMMIRGFKETLLGFFIKNLAPYSSFKAHSFAHHYSHKEWLRDIYSTLTFNHHKIWILFNIKDWLLFLASKLQNKSTQKKIARQTFDKLISR